MEGKRENQPGDLDSGLTPTLPFTKGMWGLNRETEVNPTCTGRAQFLPVVPTIGTQ